ncbi:MAG: SDR family NAD(P)-dependent oxidoreductase [Deltaproteobacteria bacterium]|nr:SDR family NAD(P)-dependent oxidoreductase [Deltaproteobacteria bacterium]
MSDELRGQRILITGASMGIGEALAREFAARGAELLLVARSEGKLRALCEELRRMGTPCEYLVADLTKPEQVASLVEKILAQGRLGGVLHNAGAGLYGAFERYAEADVRELFELNFFSVLALTRGLLPLLKKSPRPTLLLVSSIVSWRAIARLSVYSASKSALNGFAEALRVELKPDGIRVVNTYPGRTRTPFSANAKSFGWRPFSTERSGTPPEQVARKLARAYVGGKRDEFVSWSNRLLVWGNFFFPKLIDWGLGKYFQNK